MGVGLADIYTGNSDKINSILYQLLAEREEYESISHSGMPTFNQHLEFIRKKLYKGWYVIYDKISDNETIIVGSIYISYGNEIGIAIFKKYRRKGYAKQAIELIKLSHPEKFYLANINPENQKSILLFEGLGFKIIQQTYKLEVN